MTTHQTKYRKKLLPALLLTAIGLCSCSETDYMKFDTSSPGIYFTRDTLRYSFGVTPIETRTAEYRIPVRIMTGTEPHDRPFTIEVIADSTTAIEGEQYRLGQPVIPADSIDGYIPVTLLRDGLAGSYTQGYTRYKLGVRLVSGNGFSPVLGAEYHLRVLQFDNAVDQPEWLDYKGDKVWMKSELGAWHPLKLIKMVEYFHQIEEILPETYEKMVALYGPNLEHVQYGSFYVYRTVMRKHVFIKMYDYFSDPANRDEIISLYPDFFSIEKDAATGEEVYTHDFPNPFKSEG